MKKILALIVAVILMAMPVAAFAEGEIPFALPNNETYIDLYDFNLYIGDLETPYASLGIELFLDMVKSTDGAYAILGASTQDNGETPLAAGVNVREDGLELYLDGMQNSYHVSNEMLEQMFTQAKEELEKQLNISLEDLPALIENAMQQSQLSQQAFLEKLQDAVETFGKSVQLEQKGNETVTVFDQSMELVRLDLTIPAEALQQLMTDMSAAIGEYMEQMKDALSAVGVNNFKMDEANLEELQDITGTIWTNEAGDALLALIDINATNGQTMTLRVQMLTDETGVHIQLDTANPDDEEETAVFTVDLIDEQDYDAGTERAYVYITLMITDDDGEVVTSAQIQEGVDVNKDYTSAYFAVEALSDGQQVSAGINYNFVNSEEDGAFTHNGYLRIYATSGDQAYGADCSLMVVSAEPDATDNGIVDFEVPSVNLDEMTEEQMSEAQRDLQTTVQNGIMKLLSTEGISKLMTLTVGGN